MCVCVTGGLRGEVGGGDFKEKQKKTTPWYIWKDIVEHSI